MGRVLSLEGSKGRQSDSPLGDSSGSFMETPLHYTSRVAPATNGAGIASGNPVRQDK